MKERQFIATKDFGKTERDKVRANKIITPRILCFTKEGF